ncbi:DNA helicase [Gluconacetobacter sp. SXCC-1]|nr:DNA helicase [Gluconacetobacter sp. SXCC-1]
MIAQHIAAHGPIREDILVQTISRQHGFGRAGREIRERIIASIPPHLERSDEDIGTFIWPEKMSPSDDDIAFPFPEAGESVEPATLPMEMLISLARTLSSRCQNENEIINGMRDACGMARMGGSTRKRCQAAAKGAIISS